MPRVKRSWGAAQWATLAPVLKPSDSAALVVAVQARELQIVHQVPTLRRFTFVRRHFFEANWAAIADRRRDWVIRWLRALSLFDIKWLHSIRDDRQFESWCVYDAARH